MTGIVHLIDFPVVDSRYFRLAEHIEFRGELYEVVAIKDENTVLVTESWRSR